MLEPRQLENLSNKGLEYALPGFSIGAQTIRPSGLLFNQLLKEGSFTECSAELDPWRNVQPRLDEDGSASRYPFWLQEGGC